jgi:hypothetical protein
VRKLGQITEAVNKNASSNKSNPTIAKTAKKTSSNIKTRLPSERLEEKQSKKRHFFAKAHQPSICHSYKPSLTTLSARTSTAS